MLSTALPDLASAEALRLLSVPDPSQALPAGGNGPSGSPILSADGRYVVFSSAANNLVSISNQDLAGPFPPRLNVFLKDRTSGITSLVSVNQSGTGGANGDSLPSEVSTNGRFVLFESAATDLVANDTNGITDIFVRDLVAGTTMAVTVSTNGGIANARSRDPVMTPDGRYVAFTSEADNLVPSDTNKLADVFVRDLQSGTTRVVSVGATFRSPEANTAPVASTSERPRITPDGRYIAFYSTATNLVPGARANAEIFVRDTVANVTRWASPNSTNVVTMTYRFLGCSFSHALSDDGRYVAYMMNITGQTNPVFVMRHDLQTTNTVIVRSNGLAPFGPLQDVQHLDMTPDGRFVAALVNTNAGFYPAVGVLAWDGQAHTSALASINLSNGVSGNSYCMTPVINSNGRYVAFKSNATNLVGSVQDTNLHLYVRDLQNRTTLVVDADTNGATLAVDQAFPCMSADGRFFALECDDTTLVPNDSNHQPDVFVRDLVTLTNELVSARLPDRPNLTPRGMSTLSPLSASNNGRLLAFASEADDLVPNDTNRCRDVFLRDTLLGTNALVSVATNGLPATAPSLDPSISGSGRYVVFTSLADNLVAGDINRQQDIFVRDVETASTLLVSVSTNAGTPGNNGSFAPVLSSDGRFVLFRSQATDLAPGISTNLENLFLRDLQSASTVALTTNGAGAAALTPNGRYTAFGETNSLLAIWDAQAGGRIYTASVTNKVASIGVSPAGTRMIYTLAGPTNQTVFAADLVLGTNWVLATALPSIHADPQFSSDGRFASYLALNNNSNQLFIYDFQTGSNLLVSRAFQTPDGANGASDWAQFSADARYLAFRSRATDLVPGDANGLPDVFLFDRLTGVTILASANGNRSANNRSLAPCFSGDSQKVFFESLASDFASHDLNGASDLFSFILGSAPLTDADGDQMDDEWELDHFGTLARDGSGDFDHDGASDLFEFQTGTDPADSASAFRLELSSTLAGSATLSWPMAPGRSYLVQFKNELGEATWQAFSGHVVVVGSRAYASETEPVPASRFYRISMLQL